MASKQFPYQNNFSTGEVSPRFEDRTDVGKYFSALKRLINFLPFTQGGVTRRPGLRFGDNNFCDLQGRIIPFKFTKDIDSNFIVHLCDEVLSITDDKGVEVSTGALLELQCEEVIDSGIFFDTSDPLTSCAVLDCTVGSPHLNFKAIGGVAPFSWSILGPGPQPILTIAGVNNEFVQVDPPVNLVIPGGVAYKKKGHHVGFAGVPDLCKRDDCGVGCGVVQGSVQDFNCDGSFGTSNSFSCPIEGPVDFGEFLRSDNANCSGCPPVELFPPGDIDIMKFTTRGELEDVRTPAQITAGCAPCGVTVNESILTLTDAVGVMISVGLVAVT